MNKNLLTLLSLIPLTLLADTPEQHETTFFQPTHVVSSPVANCLTGVISDFLIISKEMSLRQAHDTLGSSPKSSNAATGGRINQFTANTPLTALEQRGKEVKVHNPRWPYASNITDCWIHQDHLRELTSKNKHRHPNNIPFKTDQTIFTLKTPYTDEATNTTYCVGTRFVQHITEHDIEDRLDGNLCVFNPLAHDDQTLLIPASHCVLEKIETDSEKARYAFVAILSDWTQHPDEKPAYTQGGSTFDAYAQSVKTFQEQNNTQDLTTVTVQTVKGPQEVYQRTTGKNEIATGLDPAHAISLAAELAGVPLFSGNTSHLEKSCPEIGAHEEIKSGDILWFPGGAVVLTEENGATYATSALGYMYGYGVFTKIPLDALFEGMHTIEDVRTAQKDGSLLTQLDAWGKVACDAKGEPISKKTFKFLRLVPTFSNTPASSTPH